MDYREYIDKLQSEVDILKHIERFEDVKDHIYIRLMNPLINKKVIEHLESVSFLDLAVTFVLDLKPGTTGMKSADNAPDKAGNKLLDKADHSKNKVASGRKCLIRVTENLAEAWGVSGAKLLETALENERRSTRFVSEELIDTLMRMCSREPKIIDELNKMEAENKGPDRLVIYALYEERFMNGSVALMRNEVLRKMAEKAGGDILIIPSSVNELIYIADGPDVDLTWLRSVVEDVNDTVVPDNEILSYSVYRYSVKNDCVSVAA